MSERFLGDHGLSWVRLDSILLDDVVPMGVPKERGEPNQEGEKERT